MGVSYEDLRSKPPFYNQTSVAAVDSIFTCLVDHLNVFVTDGRAVVVSSPSGRRADILIGATQFSTFYHFYNATLQDENQIRRLTIHRSETNYAPLSQAELISVANTCLGR